MKEKEKYKKLLLGLGFDARDGHSRITKGENFYLAGGSQSTHSQMQEAAIKINEELKKSHKTLETVSDKEFTAIAHKAGLKHIEKLNKENKRF